MVKWNIDLKNNQSDILKAGFPKPPGYSNDLEAVRLRETNPTVIFDL